MKQDGYKMLYIFYFAKRKQTKATKEKAKHMHYANSKHTWFYVI